MQENKKPTYDELLMRNKIQFKRINLLLNKIEELESVIDSLKSRIKLEVL